MIMILPWILGILSAWHGGRIHGGDPKAIKNLAWCFAIAIPVGIYCPLWTLVFMPLCYLKTTGHGRGFDLKEPMKIGSEPEQVEVFEYKKIRINLLIRLIDKIPLYWYKVLLMSAVGLAACSGAVAAFAVASPLAGLCVAAGGLFKGVNAMLFDKDTAVREAMDGVAVGCGILAGIAVL